MQAALLIRRRTAPFAPRRMAPVALNHMAFLVLLALASLVAAPAWADQGAQPAASAVQGWWLNDAGTAAIVIAPCGNEMCGHIGWLKTPLNAAGQPKTDIHDPDPSLRARPLCGLTMLGGFTADGSGGWHGGWVYDPKVGKTYKAVMHVAPDGTLRLRGYVGIPMFGRSETMTRPATSLPPCTPPAGASG